MMKRVLLAVAILAASAYPLMTAYKVEPVKASWSGWTPSEFPNNYISQTITCNWDSLKRVELFAGEYGSGGAYRLDVLTSPGGAEVAHQYEGTYSRPHHWVVFDSLTFTAPESIVKGKVYEFRFTRSGSDSIQYYYDEGNPYRYGNLFDPKWGEPPYPADLDLAMRVYGVMDAVDSSWFDSSLFIVSSFV